MSMATKLGRLLIYNEALPFIKSHDSSIPEFRDFRYFVSTLALDQ